LHNIIRIADIFIYPSLGEGFGIPVLEAAAAGLPCIVTDGTSLSELRPYFSGETFASDSYEEFLFCTLKVLRNMGEYILRAEVLRTTLGTTFSWERAADQFLEVALSAMGKYEAIHNHS
jgi:glycosyltransferase involved in cell wall biosynthesis